MRSGTFWWMEDEEEEQGGLRSIDSKHGSSSFASAFEKEEDVVLGW